MVAAFETIAEAAEAALEIEDPWEAFTPPLWTGAETMAADRALSEVFASIPGAMESAMPTVEGLTETMAVLIARAQAAGVLREDMIVDDIPMLMCGIGAATKKEHRCARRLAAPPRDRARRAARRRRERAAADLSALRTLGA